MHEVQNDKEKYGMKDMQNKLREKHNMTNSHLAKARPGLSKINLIKQQLEEL